MTEIWVTKTTFEKNATDGIEYFTDKSKMAASVYIDEDAGGTVQVFKCVPVDHKVLISGFSIELTEK